MKLSRLSLLFVIACLASLVNFSLWAADAPVETAPPKDLAGLLTVLIPLLAPLLVSVVKFVAPKIPTIWLPVLAPLIGAAAEILNHFELSAQNAIVGGILGLAGVGVRELVDQTKQVKAKSIAKKIAGGAAVFLCLAIPPAILMNGCGTTPNRTAYIAEGIVINTVDQASNAWLDLVLAGKVTIAQEVEFRKHYNAYLRAQRVVEDLVEAAEPGAVSDRTILEAATKAVELSSIDLIAFVNGFTSRR